MSPNINANPLANPTTGTNNVNTNSDSSGATLGPTAPHGAFPNGIPITERTMMDANWPSDLILDLGETNWLEWSHALSLAVRECGLRPWLEGSLPCPDPAVSPGAHFVWMQNDDALSAFMILRVSASDMAHTGTEAHTTAHDLFICLRTLHENQGSHAQINLFLKALQLHFRHDTPFRDTLSELRSYHRRITAMGKIKDDDILVIILLHGMSDNFNHLQREVKNMMRLPNFSSEMIVKCILDEDALIRYRQELGLPANPNDHPLPTPSSLAAQARLCPKPKLMAGCTIEEARAAYKTSLRLAKTLRPLPSSLPQSSGPTPSSTHITTTTPFPSVPSSFTSTSSPNHSIILNGRRYIPEPSSFTLHSLQK